MNYSDNWSYWNPYFKTGDIIGGIQAYLVDGTHGLIYILFLISVLGVVYIKTEKVAAPAIIGMFAMAIMSIYAVIPNEAQGIGYIFLAIAIIATVIRALRMND